MTWQSSGRRALRGQSGWAEQAEHRRILEEYRGICHVCGLPGADTVDDVIPLAEGGEPVASNKRPIHQRPCHQKKTAAEAARARARKPRRQRPPERHPGRRLTGDSRG